MSKRSGGEDNSALSPDFLDFIACLNEGDVDFVLVGGYALAFHGVIRATGDIDFVYRRTKKNVRRLCATMEDFGAPPIEGQKIRVIGLNELRKNKSATGRKKDAEDVRKLGSRSVRKDG